ncbi:toprim domain-containing protein [Flavobacteriaceae bacterium Ap0902]|nr:toprim domain-containing protein [Flavobacteriaceae bacterium Ap0902]
MKTTLKIKAIDTGNIHLMTFPKNGENHTTCPECSHTRKKKQDKCLSFNLHEGVGFCHHCNVRFVEYKPFEKEEVYNVPEWKNFTDASDKMVKWFATRSISQATLKQMNISEKKMFFPQVSTERNAICFPFYRNGELVNIKYRDAQKNFRLESGAELIWYNYDAINKHKELIITEGEIDALSFIEDGHDNVISVPNGANVGNMTYLDNSIEALEKIETFYLATDNDEKGIELRNELIRRLGVERVKICVFKQYKDANEYFAHNGSKSLSNVLKNAYTPKVEGIFSVENIENEIYNLWKNGMQRGKTIGESKLDDLISWETKRLAIFTGTPQSGKSEFVDFVNVKLNLIHKWKIGYWTPENFPIEYHYSKIAEKISGKKFSEERMPENIYYQVRDYIRSNYFWVAPESDFTLDNILEKFKFLIKTKGIKVCCLDPFNKLENKYANGESKLDYISRMLDKLIWFAKANDVLVQLVAHPRKLEKNKDGTYPMATMYDIAGSADFFNKTDYGISVKRNQDEESGKFLSNGQVSIQKVKFKHLGGMGLWDFDYNINNGRYENFNDFNQKWDNDNWLQKELKESKPLPTVEPKNAFDEVPF